MPLPQFMIASKHSLNAKLLYGLLLNRSMLSRKNGWLDDEGRVYVIYTIRQMADDLNRSQRTIQTALCELENAGLLLRRRQGFQKANLLYLRIPGDMQPSSGHDTQGITGHDAQEMAAHDAQEPSGHDAQNLPTSHTDTEYKESSQKKRGRTRRLGEFENVFLSEGEYAALQAAFPERCGEYVERLSRYMAAKDRHYANHYAVLLKWLDEDRRAAPAPAPVPVQAPAAPDRMAKYLLP